MPSASGINAITQGPIADKNGMPTYAFLKWLQDFNTRVTNGLNLLGQFIGNISNTAKIGNRPEEIGITVQNIDETGVIKANGIDFTRAYLNKTTDNIADGTGSPLAGGKAAYQALVESIPINNNSLVFSSGQWSPAPVNYSNITGVPTLPSDAPATGSKWVNSYDASTGNFTESQPSFSDISGTATAAQIPALSALTGAITTSQLPPGGFSGSVPLAKLTTGGTNGSLTVVAGLITAVTNPT